MELLDDIVRTTLQIYIIPGTYITINKCIQEFQGRTFKIIIIPNKPIPTRYKIWVKALDDYIFDFIWHMRGIYKINGL